MMTIMKILLIKEINKLHKEIDRLKYEVKIAATTDYNLCEHCLHYIPCKEKECSQYIEGVGGTINGEYKDWKWDCTQFNFGECSLLENTPCYNCVQNNYKNFELKFREVGGKKSH